MEVQAITKNNRMSAQKMREVVRQIQGLPAVQAAAVLAVVPRKGARMVLKTLKSAMANAEHIRSEWTDAKLRQEISDLRGKLGVTKNHKRRNKLQRALDNYQAFLDSPHRLDANHLIVKEAHAGAATTLKRFTPKARGSAGPVLRRNCHIKIVLADQ